MPMGAGTILVVEDDEMLRELICDSLRRYGYSVIEAPNGAEALRIGKQHQGPLHLMLTDVVMPGIDGMYLANRLTSLFPELRVLFMTGYTNSVLANSGAQHPNLNFIEKPFKPSELVRKLRETLSDSNN
jgi:DNA-binding NtrC family response regulator